MIRRWLDDDITQYIYTDNVEQKANKQIFSFNRKIEKTEFSIYADMHLFLILCRTDNKCFLSNVRGRSRNLIFLRSCIYFFVKINDSLVTEGEVFSKNLYSHSKRNSKISDTWYSGRWRILNIHSEVWLTLCENKCLTSRWEIYFSL